MSIDFDLHDRIALVTINRPERLNALDAEHYSALSDAWIRVRDDPEVRVAVVTGAGDRSFTTGADIKSFISAAPDLAELWLTQRDQLLNRGLEVWKPVIAAINGYCLGGGMTLMLATDLRVAANHATFSLAEVRRGVIPANGGTQRILDQLPRAVAMEMLLTGEAIDAQTAARWGLVNRVAAPDQLIDTSFELAGRIVAAAPLAVQAAKELAIRSRDLDLASGLRMEQAMLRLLLDTADVKEGTAAFAEKRPPRFEDVDDGPIGGGGARTLMAPRSGGVRAVIAGIGQTAYGKLPGRSTISLNVEAAREALADAGLQIEAVDGLWAKVPTSAMELLYSFKVAEAMGLHPAAGGVLDLGGASCIAMISHAVLAIDAGMCEVALVTCADNPRTGTRAAYAKSYGDGSEYGWFGIAAGYALIARRYLLDTATLDEALGAVAVACRRHGAANPRAQLRKPITPTDYAASPGVVDPLRRDDCALVSDGAAAVVIMSERRARELRVPAPVPILGFGQGHVSWDVPLRPSLTQTCAVGSATRAYRMAGIDPSQVDVAQLYDCFTITVLLQLEDYGFCGRGEAGAFVSGGAIEIGGHLPLNTSGGLLSETGMPGMQLILEGARQVRGTSSSQVRGAGLAVVSGQGGVMHTHATLVLGG